jgi:hypothetical protein
VTGAPRANLPTAEPPRMFRVAVRVVFLTQAVFPQAQTCPGGTLRLPGLFHCAGTSDLPWLKVEGAAPMAREDRPRNSRSRSTATCARCYRVNDNSRSVPFQL